jgi:bacterioferritin-associated ferredoxin
MFVGKYVCSCMKVTLKDVEEEIRNGSLTFKDIHLKTHCGAKCGACIDTIKDIVKDSVENQTVLPR